MSLPRSSYGVLVAVLAAALVSYGLAVPADAAPRTQQPTVTITLNANNSVSVNPPRVEVRRGSNARIRWQGNAPFAVVVERQSSAFPGVPAQAMAGLANRPVNAPVRGNATPGTYKYSVVVWDAGDDQMRVVDPEIVILP